MTVLRWLRAQLLDVALISAFVLACAAVIRGGKVGGLIAASLAVMLWLAATLVEQLKVRHVEDGGRVTPVRSWEKVGRESGRGVEGHAEAPARASIVAVGPRDSAGTGYNQGQQGTQAGIKPGRPLSVPFSMVPLAQGERRGSRVLNPREWQPRLGRGCVRIHKSGDGIGTPGATNAKAQANTGSTPVGHLQTEVADGWTMRSGGDGPAGELGLSRGTREKRFRPGAASFHPRMKDSGGSGVSVSAGIESGLRSVEPSVLSAQQPPGWTSSDAGPGPRPSRTEPAGCLAVRAEDRFVQVPGAWSVDQAQWGRSR